VILDAQAFEDNLIALQLGERGYVTLGDTNALASYQRCRRLESPEFNQLVELTPDNPVQQRRLKMLLTAMNQVFAYDERVIALYQGQGYAAVSKLDALGGSRVVFGNAHDVLKAFSQDEQRLLEMRGASEEADYQNAERLLVLGSALAALLLLLANQMASRELLHRRRVEIEREKLIAELQQALAEVKTLSGMIPICGWCKNVRADEGYWQSVEQYVRAHTDATFSHGMCPSCSEKFQADILKTGHAKSA